MRALKILTVVMAVMIVAGVVVLGIVISKRMNNPAASATTVPQAITSQAAQLPAQLNEPAGSHVAQLTTSGDRLILLLQGGGVADRIVVLSLTDGHLLARLSIAP